MQNAIIMHGTCDKSEYYDPAFPSLSNNHWQPWLQKQLLIQGIAAATPEIPDAFRPPHYSTWRREFERFDVRPDTILVGHSCGGGFLLRWLSEHPQLQVGIVVLVAPWIDPGHKESEDFFEFHLDPDLADRTQRLTVFESDNDHLSVTESLNQLRAQLRHIHWQKFHNYGHFCIEDMHTEAFPELLEALVHPARTT